MTTGNAHVVANEQATDERYHDELRKGDRTARAVSHGAGRGSRHRLSAGANPTTRGLVGRVQLGRFSDVAGGTEFYIGSRFVETPGLTVFGWAAPIARTLFRGTGYYELNEDVAATRTLIRRDDRIVDLVDERGPAAGPDEPFATRRLSVSKPPAKRRPLPVRAAAPARETAPPVRDDQPPPAPALGRLRVERAVRAAIAAPRRDRLSSVLATIQPDQYELAAADPDTPLFVQGHPGTGKTVVAAHRAAYLVNEASELARRPRRVLVVGPTEHYVEHIRGVLTELVEDSSTVHATSLDDLLLQLRDLPSHVDDGLPAESRDVDVKLGQLVARAVGMLRAAGRLAAGGRHRDGVREIYDALRGNRVGARRVSVDGRWATYFGRLPEFGVAQTMRRFLPLLAACSVRLRGTDALPFDHVIVDEAQDVSPLEWAVLGELNTYGSWTVLGDVNQRRSDWSCHTWDEVAESIGVRTRRIETMANGYRTTSAIMRFAGRLLPVSQRDVLSLQEGGATPRPDRVRRADVPARAARRACELLVTHPAGTVAILGLDPAGIVRALRAEGFAVDGRDSSTLARDGRAVRVLSPQDARGLEFDAVVVVEPGEFPATLGRHGLLYTSLTRANRELAIVHSAPLPKELRDGPVVPVPRRSPAMPELRAAGGETAAAGRAGAQTASVR